MQKITPFLWFNDNAEEAVNYYVSVFKNSKVKSMSRYDEAGSKASGMPVGTVMVASFEIEGQEFSAINGGPAFKFTEAVSFMINCETQEEVDYFWEKLTAGGSESQCGWLKDRFGLSWQVVPTVLGKLMGGKDPEKAGRAMKAMLGMKKIDIAKLEQA
jgi:predicted 3-demethylubiquinone-9 3-methyltransferase (glyoxalase superfamily)